MENPDIQVDSQEALTPTLIPPMKRSKRFASIDFLRGLAILIMLCLHVVMDVLDVNQLMGAINDVSILNVLALIVLPFLGGLAGFFLMVSATGNMISMMKNYQSGLSNKSIIFKQIVGGFILLMFAMLTEGIIGYQGTLGLILQHLNRLNVTLSSDLYTSFYRGWHFETIHTIAWCMIVNGAVQGILCMHDNWKNPKRLVKIYIVLAIIVLALTYPVWVAVENAMGGQTPYSVGWGDPANPYYPVLGSSSVFDVIRAFVLNPWASDPEPLFPYLAASFIGSIIGIYLTQKEARPTLKDLKKMTLVAVVMFFVGAIGLIINVTSVMNTTYGFDGAVNLYRRIWDHRWWVVMAQQVGQSYMGAPNNAAWFFQFLVLNGFGMLIILFTIRIAEFRGHAETFAKNTAWVRRYGFIAFTIYCCQFLFYLLWALVALVYNPYHLSFANGYPQLDWWGTVTVIILNVLLWQGIMKLWEKVGYAGS